MSSACADARTSLQSKAARTGCMSLPTATSVHVVATNETAFTSVAEYGCGSADAACLIAAFSATDHSSGDCSAKPFAEQVVVMGTECDATTPP